MVELGVNIDHVATLRQARKTYEPDPVWAAVLAELGGADGITLHLREDRRHIQDRDVFALRRSIRVRLNLEMANAPQIVEIALAVKPDEVCVVPERRRELTTEGGLDVVRQARRLAPTVRRLRDAGIVVSLFVEPDPEQLMASAEVGAPFVELHTGTFCEARGAAARRELARLRRAAEVADGLGLSVNAGHGINLENVGAVLAVPHLKTLNIGHSIVCRAVFVGIRAAVKEMLAAMAPYGRAPVGRR
jgi:pyridoxine 5-phosphate synthase